MSKCKYVVVMDGAAKIFEASCTHKKAYEVLTEICQSWAIRDEARVTVYKLGDYIGAATATKEWVVSPV